MTAASCFTRCKRIPLYRSGLQLQLFKCTPWLSKRERTWEGRSVNHWVMKEKTNRENDRESTERKRTPPKKMKSFHTSQTLNWQHGNMRNANLFLTISKDPLKRAVSKERAVLYNYWKSRIFPLDVVRLVDMSKNLGIFWLICGICIYLGILYLD